jgi:hypothetical protein
MEKQQQRAVGRASAVFQKASSSLLKEERDFLA